MNTTDQPAAAQMVGTPENLTMPESQSHGSASAAVPIKPILTLKASGRVQPSEAAIIRALSAAFQVEDAVALEWLCAMFARKAA